MPNIPHFDYPFRFGRDGHVATIEQDELDEVRNCVIAILLTPVGARLDLPEFGRPPVLFKENGVTTAALDTAIERWEPRAEFTFTAEEVRNLAQTVTATPTTRTQDG